MKAIVFVTIMLGAALAGCMGGSEDADLTSNPGAGQDEDPISDVVVEPEPGVYVAENRGILRGQVVNDAGFGVPDVRVSLVKTARFTSTNAAGGFHLENVTVGEHLVRAEKTNFQAAEETATVTAGNITNLTVLLLPVEGGGAGYRPHVHDYWGERPERTIMDGEVDLVTEGPTTHPTSTRWVSQTATYPNLNSTNYRYPIPLPEAAADSSEEAPEPALIYPGTNEVHVTFRWGMETTTLDQLGLMYKAPGLDDVYLAPQSSEQPWVIPTNPDITDSGHSTFSFWEFYAYTDGGPGVTPGQEPLEVVITVVKGELVLEPEHPDFWGENDTLRLRDPADPHTYNIAILTFDHYGVPTSEIRLDGGAIVPPGTKTLRMEFRWQYDLADGTPTPAVDDWQLAWRTAAQHPDDTPLEDYHRMEPVEGSMAEQYKVYEYELAPGENDAFYQKSSLWGFWPERAAMEGESYFFHDYRVRQYDFYLGVWAVKDPDYV